MTETKSLSALSGNARPLLVDLLAKTADTVAELGPGFGHYSRTLTDLSNRFSEGRFHLAVLGQFKRGKSTLLNALTGEPILPVGVVPLTAAPTFIQFGEVPKVIIQFLDGNKKEEFTGKSTAERNSFLAGFVTETGNPQNRLGVNEIHVELPTPILASGVVLIDTPGIGSTYKHNTMATLNFLQQCDAALFIVSADPPITEVELEFLRKVREKVPRLFYVMNKIDYLNGQDLEQALDFYKRVLTEQAGWDGKIPVFCVSARKGLEARSANDLDTWAESGMAKLESFLVDYLAREKFNALTDAISRRAINVLDEVLMETGIAVRALQLPQQELEEKIALFGKSLKQADNDSRLIHDVLSGDKKRVVSFLEQQAENLRQESRGLLKDIMNGYSTGSDVEKSWAEVIPRFFRQKQEELNDCVKERLLECLTPHEQRLDQLVETLRHTAATLFQVPYSKPLDRDDVLELKNRPYWVLNTWNADALPMLKSKEQRLEELALRNVENIRWSMIQNLNISFARFATRVKERLEETVAATKGAMDAANTRRNTCGGSVAAEVSRLDNLIGSLETRKKEMMELRSGLNLTTPSINH
jgi:GTPase Era involved in 16S rRNA processing